MGFHPLERNMESVLESCITGDPDAWHELFQCYAIFLYHALRRLGAFHELAEDVVADVFLRIMENGARRLQLATFESEKHLRWWLVTIARNLYFDHLRREKGKITPLETIPHLHQLAANSGVGQQGATDRLVNEISDSREVERALLSLTPRERYFTRLYYFEGLKYKEIASLAGVTTGGVASLIARAKGKLKRELKQNGSQERS